MIQVGSISSNTVGNLLQLLECDCQRHNAPGHGAVLLGGGQLGCRAAADSPLFP